MDPAFIHRQYIIKNLMINNNVLILTSGTGLGKTTKVPLYMIELFTKKGLLGEYTILKEELGKGLISNNSTYANFGIQPQRGQDPAFENYDYQSKSYSLPYINENSRVLCAVPKNVLVKENSNPDSFINKSIRNTDNSAGKIISGITTDGSNKEYGEALTFLTSGYLNQLIINDPYLTKVDGEYNISCVILDEAHERSLDIDILLVNLKKILLVRPDFKVVIMSATINTDLFKNYFFNAQVYHVNPINKQHDVDIKYLTQPCYSHIQAIFETVEIIMKERKLGSGEHILIFVSGKYEKDILEPVFTEKYRPRLNVIFVNKDYKDGFKKSQSTIFISTNVIESSVTIPKLKYVIDTGLAFNASYDSKLDMYSLNSNAITVPSADQRKGRVGRTMPGICYRLYTRKYFDDIMKKETVPEIFKDNIEIIFIKILNKQQNFLNFDFIQCPSKDQCFYTMQKLIKYNIIPVDYNICTNYYDLPDINKRNIQLYSKLSYIKGEKIEGKKDTLTVDNILLHIIMDYYDNNGINAIFPVLVNVIIMISLQLDRRFVNFDIFKWDPTQIKNEIMHIYNIVNKDTQITNFFKKFMEFFCEFFGIGEISQAPPLDEGNKTEIFGQINKILRIHGHICKMGSIEFTDSEKTPKTYYFGSRSINYTENTDYEAGYTYIEGLIMNNSIQLSLLTRYGDSSINEGEYHVYDEHQDQEQYNNYYGGGYEDEYEYEYKNKYVDF
jgi:hypothetical protein